MRPVVTTAEMAEVDRRAHEEVGLDVLVARAGFAAAQAATALLGGAYGRRVVVVAGKGHNGDDGRVAAKLLARRGASVVVVDASSVPPELAFADLVVDAAFGTGLRGDYRATRPPKGAAVLAVDIPSGLHADDGTASADGVVADETITFGALKPGLLLGEGPSRAGRVTVAEIGLSLGEVRMHLVGPEDLAWLPPRRVAGHKWDHAVFVLAGSEGMLGSAALCSTAALRSGSGMVHLGSPGVEPGRVNVVEVVSVRLEKEGFGATVLQDLPRFKSAVIGPGLGTAPETRAAVREVIAGSSCPLVIDADGLNVLGRCEEFAPLISGRNGPVVLTPHEGEFARLAGGPVSDDRLASVRRLAAASGATVLLKGPTTVVCDPSGEVLLSNSGSPRLSTAGTGDVLGGIIAAFLARGLPPLQAGGLAAFVHGLAARRAPVDGLLSGDLAPLVAAVLTKPGDG